MSKEVKPENIKYSLKVKKLTTQDVQGELDTMAAALYPDDPLGLFQFKVGNDGNYCPRALSVLAYRKEDYHAQMQTACGDGFR